MKGLMLVLIGIGLFCWSLYLATSAKKKAVIPELRSPSLDTNHRNEADWKTGIPANRDTSDDSKAEDKGGSFYSMPPPAN